MKDNKRFYSARVQRKRERLLSVIGRLFLEKGYASTTIDDIASAAKVNRAIVYYYFDDKTSILYELATKSMQTLIAKALPILHSDMGPEGKLKAFIINHVEFSLKNLGLSGIGQLERRNLPKRLLHTYTSMRDEYEGMFREILAEGKREGKFKFHNTKLTSLFILGFLNSIFQWYKSSEAVSPEEIASESCEFVFSRLVI